VSVTPKVKFIAFQLNVRKSVKLNKFFSLINVVK